MNIDAILYALQKLVGSPECLAKCSPVTHGELKAFVGVNIIMGTVRIPSVASYWSSNDLFGNVGNKKSCFRKSVAITFQRFGL